MVGKWCSDLLVARDPGVEEARGVAGAQVVTLANNLLFHYLIKRFFWKICFPRSDL